MSALCLGLTAKGGEGVQAPLLRIALLPFEDRAGFQGKWNLATDVPVLLGQYMSEEAAIRVIPMDSVEAALCEKTLEKRQELARAASLGRHLGADLVIIGRGKRRREELEPKRRDIEDLLVELDQAEEACLTRLAELGIDQSRRA